MCSQPPHSTAGRPVALHQRRQEGFQTAELRLHVPPGVEVQDTSSWQVMLQLLLQQLHGVAVDLELVLQSSKSSV